jgi:RNA polymerase sigma-70 factor, ECF subfamily
MTISSRTFRTGAAAAACVKSSRNVAGLQEFWCQRNKLYEPLPAGTRQTLRDKEQMAEGLPDLEVVKQIAAGDKRALATLYARHSDRTFKFLCRLTSERATAEDLTHDVFLEVWRGASRFEARSSVATWILSIARYKALDARRKRRTLTEHDLPGRTEPTPEMTAMQSSSGTYMRECLAQLSLEHREIIDLVYYHEKSVKEVSEILDIPENTVKTRMFYARKKLKEMLLAAGDQRDDFSYGK